MEKPAVMFSEQGFKLFLNFIKDLKDGETTDSSVDTFVNAYYAKAKSESIDAVAENVKKVVNEQAPYDTIDASDTVSEIVSGYFDPVSTSKIRKELELKGINKTMKQMSWVMTKAMDKDPCIVKIDRGLYSYDESKGTDL